MPEPQSNRLCVTHLDQPKKTKPMSAEPRLPTVLRVPRTDPVYNCHAYLTKVPVGAITPFVEAFSEPGDRVLDFFAGSGMTGVAAYKSGRTAVLSDISALGRHIATGYLTPVNEADLRRAAELVMDEARDALGDLYSTVRLEDGAIVELVRTVWSFTYECPSCAEPLVYYEELRDGRTKQPKECKACGQAFVRRTWGRRSDVPVEVALRNVAGRIVEQPIGSADLDRIRRAAEDPRQSRVPTQAIPPDREMYRRSALGRHGLTETKAFFSPRNALALLELWSAIARLPDVRLRQKLRFAFTAILPRASRRYQWGPKRPLNAQNQTYYIAPVYYEWNVFELFQRKVDAALRSDAVVFDRTLFSNGDGDGDGDGVRYELASADALHHVADESIDYVFTDPPFGSNIFYSDMNLFHEAWLATLTDPSREAVIQTAKAKRDESKQRYLDVLTGAFREAFRVLKAGRYMSVVFGNSSGEVWSLVQRALREAGFVDAPTSVTILDKGQRSVKGLNSGSESVVTVDLVLTVRKPEGAVDTQRSVHKASAGELLRPALKSLDPERGRNPSYVYAAIIREAIEARLDLDNLHLADVLMALRRAGHEIDPRSGLLKQSISAASLRKAFDSSEAHP